MYRSDSSPRIPIGWLSLLCEPVKKSQARRSSFWSTWLGRMLWRRDAPSSADRSVQAVVVISPPSSLSQHGPERRCSAGVDWVRRASSSVRTLDRSSHSPPCRTARSRCSTARHAERPSRGGRRSEPRSARARWLRPPGTERRARGSLGAPRQLHGTREPHGVREYPEGQPRPGSQVRPEGQVRPEARECPVARQCPEALVAEVVLLTRSLRAPHCHTNPSRPDPLWCPPVFRPVIHRVDTLRALAPPLKSMNRTIGR